MSEWKPNPELVKLVAETVEDIAIAKGLTTYPKQPDVELILYASHILGEAMEMIKKNEVANEYKPGG